MYIMQLDTSIQELPLLSDTVDKSTANSKEKKNAACDGSLLTYSGSVSPLYSMCVIFYLLPCSVQISRIKMTI